MRKAILIALSIILPLMLVGCVSMALPRVPGRLAGEAAQPVLPGPDTQSLDAWESARPALLDQFADTVYGAGPDTGTARLIEQQPIEAGAWEGLADIEQWRVEMAGMDTHVVTLTPAAPGPHPVVILQLFCGNQAALGGREDVAPPLSPYAPDCSGTWQMIPIRMIFGEHISEPPLELILSRGYAVALVYPGDIVPDSASGAPERLTRLVGDRPAGAIAAWAWVYSQVVDLLEADERYDADRMAVWGHSRNGKSALLAAAYDRRIDLVIAHQAGTGGTTLTRSYAGESVAQITEGYPHWFAPAYATYAEREQDIPVDQHQLIALVAPRPVLIGAAWRDQWSDPQGSFRAAQGATPVYQLYGSDGLRQARLADYDPSADLALFMRPGLHGVNGRDWAYFLDFLDAHFQPR